MSQRLIFNDSDQADVMTQQIEAYGTPQAATTSYAYNIYNEVTMTTGPEGEIRKKFYSDSGSLTAKAAYTALNSDNEIVSEVQYVYNDYGWLGSELVADHNGAFTLGSPDNWITTSYLYDDYGRKTAVSPIRVEQI